MPDALEILRPGLTAGRRDATRVRALMTRGFAWCFSPNAPDSALRATSDLDEAFRLASELGSAELRGEVMLRRGACALVADRLADAEAAFAGALELARREQLALLEVNAMGSLGVVCTRTDRFDQGANWFRRALDLALAIGADLQAAKTRGNLGWAYLVLGDNRRALIYLQECVDATETVELDLDGDRMVALTNLGNVHFRLGELAQAAKDYRRALEIARRLQNHRHEAELLADLGQIAAASGRYDEAAAWAASASTLAANLGGGASARNAQMLLLEGDILSGQGRLSRAEARYRALLATPALAQERGWQARLALARLHARTDRPAEAERLLRLAVAERERTWRSIREIEHRLPYYAGSRAPYDELVDLLVRQGRAEQALDLADRSRARLLQERLGSVPPPHPAATSRRWQALAARLRAVFLVYWVAPARSFVWVVTPEQTRLRVLPPAADLARGVEDYRGHLMRSRDPLHDGLASTLALWNGLLAPVAGDIAAGSRVIVVPDGPLHQLNLETLVVPADPPRYWVEDVTLMVAPSLSLLDAGEHGGGVAERSLLVLGDPRPPDADFPPLAFAAAELRAVASHFDEARRLVRSGEDATPRAYREARPERFRYLHFAAHATTSAERPLESAVVLSGPPDAYKLYAGQIAAVPLRAELVTLSACRSAGTRAFDGEGLVGLAWAFLGAGAGHVIGGLWDVSDDSTSRLMAGLYRALERNPDPAAALRTAKLELLRSSTAHRKPFYWAPFVVYARRPAAGTTP